MQVYLREKNTVPHKGDVVKVKVTGANKRVCVSCFRAPSFECVDLGRSFLCEGTEYLSQIHTSGLSVKV